MRLSEGPASLTAALVVLTISGCGSDDGSGQNEGGTSAAPALETTTERAAAQSEAPVTRGKTPQQPTAGALPATAVTGGDSAKAGGGDLDPQVSAIGGGGRKSSARSRHKQPPTPTVVGGGGGK